MADIAKRSGRSPESIRLLVSGKRGPGGFRPPRDVSIPAPRSGAGRTWESGSRQTLDEPLPDTSDSAFLQAFNDALEIRRLGGATRQATAPGGRQGAARQTGSRLILVLLAVQDPQ